MPAIEAQNRFQKATLWAKYGTDRNGEVTVSSPVNIKVRWDAGLSATVDQTGTTTAKNGTVIVNQDVTEGSILRLGEVCSLPTPVTDGLFEIMSFKKTPDVKGRKFARSAEIRRYKGQLPTVV